MNKSTRSKVLALSIVVTLLCSMTTAAPASTDTISRSTPEGLASIFSGFNGDIKAPVFRGVSLFIEKYKSIALGSLPIYVNAVSKSLGIPLNLDQDDRFKLAQADENFQRKYEIVSGMKDEFTDRLELIIREAHKDSKDAASRFLDSWKYGAFIDSTEHTNATTIVNNIANGLTPMEEALNFKMEGLILESFPEVIAGFWKANVLNEEWMDFLSKTDVVSDRDTFHQEYEKQFAENMADAQKKLREYVSLNMSGSSSVLRQALRVGFQPNDTESGI